MAYGIDPVRESQDEGDSMTTKMTKRQFLQSIGAAAGVAAVYRSMNALGLVGASTAQAATLDLSPGSGDGKSVVILGAGISGLVAAYELSKAGYDCTILEATNRAGGRNLTARGGDIVREEDSRQWVGFDPEEHLYANLGPARIPHHHTTILGYCKAFGVDLEVFTNDNRAAFFHNLEHFDGKPVVARQVMTDTRGYLAELLAKAVNRNALDDVLTGEDKERLLDLLRSYGDLDAADDLYTGSDRGGYQGKHIHAGLAPGEVNDPLDFSQLLSSDFWEYKLHFSQFLDQNPTLLQPVGGMDAIVDAFEERLEHLIRYRSIVEEIRKTADGVRIVYRRRRRRRPENPGCRLCDLHHPCARSEGYSQRLFTRDTGGDCVNRVRQRSQNRFPGPAAFLGGRSRSLWRYFLDRSGYYADMVSVLRLSAGQGDHPGRLYLG